jgi:hypothetical protein
MSPLHPRTRLALTLTLALAFGLSGAVVPAAAEWPNQFVHSNTASSLSGKVGGLVFDSGNEPIVAWQEVDASSVPRPRWARRLAGVSWQGHRVVDHAGWSLLRGNVTLAITSADTAYLGYLSGFPGSEAYGSKVVNLLRLKLAVDSVGPGTYAGYIGQDFAVPSPLAEFACGSGDAAPLTLFAHSYQCGGGIAVVWPVMDGSGFLSRADAGPGLDIRSASFAIAPDGTRHVVYNGTSCQPVGRYFRHHLGVTAGAGTTIDNSFDGRSDLAIDTQGVLHVAGTRPNGELLYWKSTDNGATWTPLAVIASDAWGGAEPSISAGATGELAIAYWASDRRRLIVRRSFATGWNPTTAATVGADAVGEPKLAHDRLGKASVFYYDPGTKGFYFASSPDFVDVPDGPPAGRGPAATLALGRTLPNPVADGAFDVEFTLPSSAPAALTLVDVSGRQVLAREVGGLGAGPHRLKLSPEAPLAPGIYFLRLSQAGRSLTSRVSVLR